MFSIDSIESSRIVFHNSDLKRENAGSVKVREFCHGDILPLK